MVETLFEVRYYVFIDYLTSKGHMMPLEWMILKITLYWVALRESFGVHARMKIVDFEF